MPFFDAVNWLHTISPGATLKIVLAVLCACISAFLFPIPMLAAWQVVQDYLADKGQFVFPLGWCTLAALAVVFSGVLRVVSSYLAHSAAFDMSRAMRIAVLAHIGQLPLHWFSDNSNGNIKKVISVDIGEVESFLAHNITDFFHAMLVPILCIALLFWVNALLALLLLAVLLAAAYFHIASFRKAQKSDLYARYSAALGLLHSDTQEFVCGMPIVKIYNKGMDTFGKMQQAITSLKNMQSEVLGFHSLAWARFLGVIALPLSLVAVAGGFLFQAGHIALDHLIFALLLSGVALLPIQRLMRFITLLQFAQNGWKSMSALLAEPVEKKGIRKASEVDIPTLEVKNLSLELDGTLILNDISFIAKSGTVTAIVGPSGSGKSTLAAVLAGMEKMQSGSINIGNIAIPDFSNTELAKLFAVVFQRPFLFTGTVKENIVFGKEDATQEELDAAVSATCCQDIIDSLPHGYETIIGAGGETHLSGGQHQRLALARMALRNAPIVLLDEATAFADPESEAAIQNALADVLARKTTIVISHRLASIAEADNIIVLEKGRIVEQGTHEELMVREQTYWRLWQANQTARSWSIPINSIKSGLQENCEPKEQAC